ncbi:5870_t:CDS:2, partial [Scutellospora calospora]
EKEFNEVKTKNIVEDNLDDAEMAIDDVSTIELERAKKSFFEFNKEVVGLILKYHTPLNILY